MGKNGVTAVAATANMALAFLGAHPKACFVQISSKDEFLQRKEATEKHLRLVKGNMNQNSCRCGL